MRNLKRALSLALASVMLLGMMVVGTSAASYPDVDENDNVEAIEVLNAVKVMIGDRGNFRPDASVNRHEMATIMAKLVLGNEVADNYVGSHPFTDTFPWADKYVAACYENDLISGTSATTFSGNQPLTAVQAASMMLRALGYKDLNKGASDWRAPLVSMANQLRLFNGVTSNPNQQLNRNQVAQLVLNTLKSSVVDLKDNTFTATDGNGQLIISGGNREYIVRSSSESYARAINRTEERGTSASSVGGYTIELGEHLYNGKLKLNNLDRDVFGRPARTWEYDGKAIGTYGKEELLDKSYVGKVTGKDLYDLLGKSTLDKYEVYCWIDGVETGVAGAKTALGDAWFDSLDMNKDNKAGIGGTGTGVATEVYVDHEENEVNVVVVNTYLAKATKDYDEKKEEAPLTAYAMKKSGSELYKVPQRTATGSSVSLALAIEDFPFATEIKKDDFLLIQVADGEVQNYKAAEVLEGVTITSFKKNDNVVTGGSKYSYTTTADYKWADDINKSYTGGSGITNLKNRTYNIYLDAYGNLIGIEEIEAKKNYVFITGIDLNGSNITNTTADANAIFLDGTMETIKVNMTKSTLAVNRDDDDAILNTWCTYTKSGDVYTVKEVSDVGVTSAGATHGGTVANYPSSTNGNLAQFNQTHTADMAVGGKNIRMYGGGDGGTNETYTNVYGDSDTVYLTAELGELRNSKGNYGIIDDVVSVTTGVANTSLTAYSDANAVKSAETDKVAGTVTQPKCSSGIYGLYNDSGLIIAAVVIGEDAGTAKDMVYVHSSGLEEEIDNGNSSSRAGNDDLWTWTRKVIRDGEEVLLTEVGDNYKTGSSLADMKQYQWYEVRTNADGHVTKVVDAVDALKSTSSKYVTDYKLINSTVETAGVDTVLYLTNGGPEVAPGFGAGNKLEVKGTNTLAVTGLQGSGIYFNNDVNVTLQYWNKNTKQTDIMGGEGLEDLKTMVDIVNENSASRGTSTYYISALIQDGRATDIVIYDSYNNYQQPDRPAITTEGVTAVVNNGVIDVTFTDVHYNSGDLLGAVKNALIDEGYTNVNVAFLTSLPADGAASDKGALTVAGSGFVTARDAYNNTDVFTVRYINYWTVKVDDVVRDTVAHKGTTKVYWEDVKSWADTTKGSGSIITFAGGTQYYLPYSQTGIVCLADNMVAPVTIDTGYLGITKQFGSLSSLNWTVSGTTVISGVDYVKAGDTLTVTAAKSKESASAEDQVLTVTAFVDGRVVAIPAGDDGLRGTKTITISKEEWNKADSVFVFTFNTSGWDLPVTIGSERDDVITSDTISATATDGNGLTISNVTLSNARAHKGDTVSVTATISGTATAAGKITFGGTDVTGVSFSADGLGYVLEQDASNKTTVLTVKDGVEFTATVTWNFTLDQKTGAVTIVSGT